VYKNYEARRRLGGRVRLLRAFLVLLIAALLATGVYLFLT
jgi:hypothetical protein